MPQRPWVVITGCSSGIGLSCVKKFLGEGYSVLGTYRNLEKSNSLIASLGDNFIAIQLDISREDSIMQASKEIEQIITSSKGYLACLINNAGIAVGGPLKYIDIRALKRQFEVNVFGLMHFTQMLLPLMGGKHENRKKRIFNMSSVSGKFSNPFLGPYAGSKFALEALSDALRLELKLFDIGVTLIEPGPISTPIWDKSISVIDQYAHTEYAPYIDQVNQMINTLKKEALSAEHVANLIYKSWKKSKPDIRILIVKHPWLLNLFLRIVPDRLKDWINLSRLK